MEQQQITYAEFATRVMGITENGIFKAMDSLTGKVLYEHEVKPFSTTEGADSFFKALYKVKGLEM